MSFFSKRVGIKIPKHIAVLYNQKKNHLMLIGPSGSKTILLKFKLFFVANSHLIFVMTFLGNTSKKQVKTVYGSFRAELNQAILEVSVRYHKSLKLIGVGFKVYLLNIETAYVLQFKLGFSHFIFYKIPRDVSITTLKETKVFLTNPCLKKVTQISAIIRSFKFPEIYKGKGILYHDEKVSLKKGKKIS